MKGNQLDLDPDIESIPTTAADDHWDRRIELREALGRLSAEERQIIILFDWQGYSYQEIATLLEIPLGTVKSRLHTARMHLRTILSD